MTNRASYNQDNNVSCLVSKSFSQLVTQPARHM